MSVSGLAMSVGKIPMTTGTWRCCASVLIVSSALTGCGIGGPAYAPPPAGVAALVATGLISYDPATVTIRAGQTVEWRNTSILTHTVTGEAGFESGNLVPGQVYSHRFDAPGTYRYFCRHHDTEGMVGTVIVRQQ